MYNRNPLHQYYRPLGIVLMILMFFVFSNPGNAQTNIFVELIKEGDIQYKANNFIKAFELFIKAKEKAVNTTQSNTAEARAEQTRKAIIQQQTDLQNALKETKDALKIAKEMQKKVETAMFDKAVRERFPTWQVKSGNTDNNILESIDTLNLSDMGLFHIPDEVTRCPNLKYINLISNMNIDWQASEPVLSRLDSNISIFASLHDFQGIPKKYRHLIKGAVIYPVGKNIPEDVMQQKQLTHLQVIGAITGVPENIGDLTNLIKLDFENNQLKEIPNSVGKLIKLEIFRCGSNNLSSIPNEICELINLRELSVPKNNLAEIPQLIGNLKNLEYLDLSENHIGELPSGISNLSLLSQLDLHSNYFSEIPIEIGSLYDLKVLNLSSLNSYETPINEFGEITEFTVNSENYSLPVEICNLHKLTDLNLSNLGLTFIPQEISKLRSLKVLNLSSNHLDQLPKEIENLKDIDELDISSNDFNKIPPGVLSMPKLQRLDCRGNEIDSISTMPFELKMPGYVFYDLGVQLMENNNFEQALISFNHSIDPDFPTRSETYGYMALCANKLNNSIAVSEYLNLYINETYKQPADDSFISMMLNRFLEMKCYNLAYSLTSLLISKTDDFWYAHCIICLYAGKPLEAIDAATKSIEINPLAKSFESNLALGFLLSNQWKKAEEIYQKWDGQTFPDTEQKCRQIFLEDILNLEKAGITHPDFQKARDMLNN